MRVRGARVSARSVVVPRTFTGFHDRRMYDQGPKKVRLNLGAAPCGLGPGAGDARPGLEVPGYGNEVPPGLTAGASGVFRQPPSSRPPEAAIRSKLATAIVSGLKSRSPAGLGTGGSRGKR